jgi:ferredoxin
MRVIVDPELCEGNAVCVKHCPEVFELSEDDRAQVLVVNPSEDLRAKVELAVRRCPRRAIRLED